MTYWRRDGRSNNFRTRTIVSQLPHLHSSTPRNTGEEPNNYPSAPEEALPGDPRRGIQRDGDPDHRHAQFRWRKGDGSFLILALTSFIPRSDAAREESCSAKARGFCWNVAHLRALLEIDGQRQLRRCSYETELGSTRKTSGKNRVYCTGKSERAECEELDRCLAWLSVSVACAPGLASAKPPPGAWRSIPTLKNSCVHTASLPAFTRSTDGPRVLMFDKYVHSFLHSFPSPNRAAGAPQHPRAGVGESGGMAGAPQRRDEGHSDLPPAGVPPRPNRLRAVSEPGTRSPFGCTRGGSGRKLRRRSSCFPARKVVCRSGQDSSTPLHNQNVKKLVHGKMILVHRKELCRCTDWHDQGSRRIYGRSRPFLGSAKCRVGSGKIVHPVSRAYTPRREISPPDKLLQYL